MKRIRYVEVFCILALTLAVGIFLPSYISRAQEEKLLDQTVIEETDTVHISRTEKMEDRELLEKFAFLLNENVEYIEYVPLAGGKNMDYEVAYNAVYEEIWELYNMGLMAEPQYYAADGRLYTAANTENPSQSLVVWQWLISGDNGAVYLVTQDDATGKIIGLQMISLDERTDASFGYAYEDIAYLWGSYLGMQEMAVDNITYEDISAETILDGLGNQKKLVLEKYGITDNIIERYYRALADAVARQEKEFLQNNPNLDGSVQDKYVNEIKIYEGVRAINLYLTYYSGNGKEVSCVVEWNFMGYNFCSAPETEDGEIPIRKGEEAITKSDVYGEEIYEGAENYSGNQATNGEESVETDGIRK